MPARSLRLVLLPLVPLAAFAQTPQPRRPHLDPTAAPAIRSAHRIFLANGGVDNTFTLHTGKPEATLYNSVYAALQSGPGVQMVDTTQQADLVLTITGSAVTTIYEVPTNDDSPCTNGTLTPPGLGIGNRYISYVPLYDSDRQQGADVVGCGHKNYKDQASITLAGFIPDARGLRQVWGSTLSLDKPKLGIAQAAYRLVNQLLSDAGRSTTTTAFPSRRFAPPAAPLPALLRESTTVMVVGKSSTPVLTPVRNTSLPLSISLRTWAHDTLTTNPANANLLFVIEPATHHDDTLYTGYTRADHSGFLVTDTLARDTAEPALRLEVIERSTGLTLWTVEAPFQGDPAKAKDQPALKHTVDRLVEQLAKSTGLPAHKPASLAASTTE